MAFYRDLKMVQIWNYVPKCRAVGFLEPGNEYPHGNVSGEFFDRLFNLLVDVWEPAHEWGYHRCGFCLSNRSVMEHRGKMLSLGNGYLFVPGPEKAYVAPVTVAHYVQAHDYFPPQEFQKAVLDCPAMWSKEYFAELEKWGFKLWFGQDPNSTPPCSGRTYRKRYENERDDHRVIN